MTLIIPAFAFVFTFIISNISHAENQKFQCNETIQKLMDRDWKIYGIKEGFKANSSHQEEIKGYDPKKFKNTLTRHAELFDQKRDIRTLIMQILDPKRTWRSERDKREIMQNLEPLKAVFAKYDACLATAGQKKGKSKIACRFQLNKEIVESKVNNAVIDIYKERDLEASRVQTEFIQTVQLLSPSAYFPNVEFDKVVRYSYPASKETNDKPVAAFLYYKNGKLAAYEVVSNVNAENENHRLVDLDNNCKVTGESKSGFVEIALEQRLSIPREYWKEPAFLPNQDTITVVK